MAKKQEEKLMRGQLPTPNIQKSYATAKYDWSGLNRRHVIDTGYLSYEKNISTEEAPYLTPSKEREELLSATDTYANPIAMFGFDDVLIVIYSENNTIKIDYHRLDDINQIYDTYTGIVEEESKNRTEIHSMVQFNKYSSVNDVMSGVFIKRLLVFPEKKAMYFNIIDYNGSSAPEYKKDMDLNAMYCWTSGDIRKYYVWKNYDANDSDFKNDDGTDEENGGKFVQTGDDNYFTLDALDVDVKTYYNDGFARTNDITYDPDREKTYYTREYDSAKKEYNYTKVDNLSEGNDVSKLYEKQIYKSGYIPAILNTVPENNTVNYYEKKDNGEFVLCNELHAGTSLKGYYEYIQDYYPPDDDADKSYYYYNSSDNNTYKYVQDDGYGNAGWRVSASPAFPDIKYAVVHQSRLCGVDNDRIFISGFNDYSNWNYDVLETNESNAWCTAAQANTKADGIFMGITVYDNHAVCFKKDFMQEVYNNKNPFRVVDVYPEGCIDNRSIQEVDGKLFFVSDNEVKLYTGANPKNIGYLLNIDRFDTAIAGGDGRNYYLFYVSGNESGLVVYDTFAEAWSVQDLPQYKEGSELYSCDVLSFAHNNHGMFMLTKENGQIYKMDTNSYSTNWAFETDMSTAVSSSTSSGFKSMDIKHIRKIQLYGDFSESSRLKIYGLYDNEEFNANSSHLLFDSGVVDTKKHIPIRLRPRMTANYGFKLHFQGSGYVKIYSLEVYKTRGGDLYKTGSELYSE